MAQRYSVSTLKASGTASVAFSPDQKTLYVAMKSGAVEAFDLATGNKIASWRIGSTLGGISVSEDGSFLLVTETVTGPVAAANLFRLSTVTGAVTRYSYSAGNSEIGAFRDVEIVNDRYALVTGGGMEPLQFDLAAGTFFPVINGRDYSNSSLLVEDRSLTLFAEPGISNGPLRIWDDRQQRIVAQGDSYQSIDVKNGSTTGFNWGSQAISEAAGLAVQFLYYNTMNVYDLSLKLIGGVSLPGRVDGLAFDRSGKFLYAYLIDTGEIAKFAVADWTIVERFAVARSDWHNRIGFGTQLSLSDDGRYIVIADSSDRGSVQLVTLPVAAPGGSAATLALTEAGGTVINADRLTGETGVQIAAANAHFINSGTIAPSGFGASVAFTVGGGVFANTATGTIGHTDNQVAIRGSAGADTVFNLGRINGTVYLGDGNDTFIDQGGVISAPGRRIYLEAGDDTLRFDGALNTAYFASGGDGFDTVYVTGPSNDASGSGLNGFEKLVVEKGINLQQFNYYQEIVLGAGVDANFISSFNPAVDLQLRGQSLTMSLASFRSVTGSTMREMVYLGNGATIGDVRLGGGNDVVYFGTFFEPVGGVPTVSGVLDGGPGVDALDIVVGDGLTTVHDFSRVSGFETLSLNASYTYLTGIARIIGLSGIGSVLIGPRSTLQLDASDLTGANVFGALGGGLVIGTGTVIANFQGFRSGYALPDGGGDSRFDSTLVNRGTITGDVTFHLGDDVYDGSGGSVGGLVHGGGGADRLTGGAGRDRLDGGDGDDRLEGGAGADALTGGDGIDVAAYTASDAGVTVSLTTGRGAGGHAQGDTLSGIENLVGSRFADTLTGNASANRIEAGDGADMLDGGAGADTLIGGAGDDGYVVDDVGDVVTELADGGTDTVFTSLSGYVLPDNVERLVFTGTGGGTLVGRAGRDVIEGGSGNDLFRMEAGGDDDVAGGAGGDTFLFGRTLTAADVVDGGAGADVLAIQGNYTLTLGAGSLRNVETLTPLSGTDARFGDAANNRYSYALTSVDANVAAGQMLKVNASQLATGENFTFDGSAERDGSFFLYGGEGTDTLTGGAGADVFFLAEGRFNAGDTFAGNAGADIVVLRGSVTAAFGASTFTGIETVTLMSATDNRFFTGGTQNRYDITSHDGNVAAGATMTVNGGALVAGETMRFDGAAERDGAFRLFGGAADDVLRGGAGADLIYGGLGADLLTGGAGADVFRYQGAGESVLSARDTILDFASGDRIDLTRIDANAALDGDQAFGFIGGGAFTGTAAQLRATQANGRWTIEADLDGDGTADFSLLVDTLNGHQIGAGDFLL